MEEIRVEQVIHRVDSKCIEAGHHFWRAEEGIHGPEKGLDGVLGVVDEGDIQRRPGGWGPTRDLRLECLDPPVSLLFHPLQRFKLRPSHGELLAEVGHHHHHVVGTITGGGTTGGRWSLLQRGAALSEDPEILLQGLPRRPLSDEVLCTFPEGREVCLQGGRSLLRGENSCLSAVDWRVHRRSGGAGEILVAVLHQGRHLAKVPPLPRGLGRGGGATVECRHGWRLAGNDELVHNAAGELVHADGVPAIRGDRC
mmetsp:Transcript_8765/g.24959  ORF Transcript_8765/g.24959 Transcript_8765/m.24959 type:complete len:254 (-) Transcript_8765:782-1543(-)